MDRAVSVAVEYARVRLPRQPLLASWITSVDLGDDRLQLRGAEFSFTLGHRFLIDLFNRVSPLLDGSRTVNEIAAEGGPGVQPATVIFLLQMLHANGLLQEGAIPPTLTSDDLAHWDRHLRFLAHYVSDPLAAQAVLSRAHVGVLGSDRLRDDLRIALESVGIGCVVTIGPAAVVREGADWANHLADAQVDLLVAGMETPGFAFFNAVNAACLERGTRWLRVAFEGATALLGPTILPHQSACYTCYDLRVRSNLSDLEGFDGYRDRFSQAGGVPDEGVLAPLRSVVVNQAAMEIGRILTGFAPPMTIGRFYEINARTPSAKGHDVLRVPRCPSCRLSSVRRAAWDQTATLLDQ